MLGQYLKQTRLKLNMTQKQMSEKIGISLCYYIQIERSNRKPGIMVVNKIAQFLKVEPQTIRGML